MILRAISDLHGHLPDVAPCDVLAIAGDVCPHFGRHPGTPVDLLGQARWLDTTFRAWLDAVPADHVVATLGNHDFVGQPNAVATVPADLRWSLLIDAGTTVAGLQCWGSPWSPWFNGWAFNAPRSDPGESFLRDRWSQVPPGTDVLIVHGPPRGYGDRTDAGQHVGSDSLTARIAEVEPRLSLHGHIHAAHGRWTLGPTTIANVTVLNESYRPAWEPTAFEL